VQVVSPGRSIQAAVDRAPAGGWVYVLPGVNRETADATNGLNITKPINLVGLSLTPKGLSIHGRGGRNTLGDLNEAAGAAADGQPDDS
jgi:hypothetical protein